MSFSAPKIVASGVGFATLAVAAVHTASPSYSKFSTTCTTAHARRARVLDLTFDITRGTAQIVRKGQTIHDADCHGEDPVVADELVLRPYDDPDRPILVSTAAPWVGFKSLSSLPGYKIDPTNPNLALRTSSIRKNFEGTQTGQQVEAAIRQPPYAIDVSCSEFDVGTPCRTTIVIPTERGVVTFFRLTRHAGSARDAVQPSADAVLAEYERMTKGSR